MSSRPTRPAFMVFHWSVRQTRMVLAVGLQRHEGGAGQAHQGKGRVEPEDPSIRQAKRARALQTELKRVGCDPGAVDGRWGEKAKAALGQFINLAKLELRSDEPTEAALSALALQKRHVCPSHEAPSGTTRAAREQPPSRPSGGKEQNGRTKLCWGLPPPNTSQLTPCPQ